MSDEPLRVLLVDDEQSLRDPLAKHLRERCDYEVDAVADAYGAWRLVNRATQPYDVVLIDDMLIPEADAEPELIGIDLMRRIRARCSETECIVFTGWGMKRALEALRAGAYRYLAKPLNLDELSMTIRMAAEQGRLRRERDLLSTILEISNAMVGGLDVTQTLEVIAEAVPKLSGAEACAVAWENPVTEQVRYEPKKLMGDVAVRWNRHLKEGSLTRQIIDSGEMFVLADVDTRADEVDENLYRVGVKSFVGMPIRGESQNQGVLYAYSTRREAFGAREQRILELLADQAAIALENARLFEAERTQTQRQTALSRLSARLAATLNEEEVCRRVVEELHETLNYDCLELFLVDETTAERVLTASAGWPDAPLGWRIPPGQGLSERPILDGQLHYTADVTCDPRYLPGLNQGAEVDVPLQLGEEVMGVLVAESKRPAAFARDDFEVLGAAANQAATAISKARLYETQRQQADELARLHRASATLFFSATADLPVLAQNIVEAVLREFGQANCSLLLLNPDTGELERIGAAGPYTSQVVQARLTLEGPGLVPRAVRTGRLVNVPDVLAHPDYVANWDRARSEMAVPLQVGERVIGALDVQSIRPAAFGPIDERLLTAFAERAALALENARLFSELAETQEWREALIEHAFDAVIAIDQNKRITVFNQRAEEMLGWTAEEMIGKTVARLHTDIDRAREIWDAINRKGAIFAWDVKLKHRDGSIIPTQFSATLIENSDGQPIGQAGFMRDLRRVNLLEERLLALIRVSQAITGTLELSRVLDLIVAFTVDAFPTAQSASIHLYDESAGILRVEATTVDYSAAALKALSFRVGEGIAGWVFENEQPLVVDDAQQELRYKCVEHPEAQVHRSMLCVPLRVKEQVIGTLSLNNGDLVGAFQADDSALLLTFADQAAIAIENARLHQQTARRQQLLTALDEALRHIRAEKETSKLSQEIVRLAAELVGCRAGGLYLNHPHLEELELVATYGLDTEPTKSRLSHTEGLVGLVARTGKPKIVRRFSDWSGREAVLESYNLRTVVGVPFRHAGEVEAVLFVADDTSSYRFAEADLEILERFALQASLALQTSRLMDKEEQRALAHLATLHKVSDYIQAAGDLEKIVHVLLTIVTAGYGLGFNRAALFLLDEAREKLIGRKGIGHLDEEKARADWARDERRRVYDVGQYLELLEQKALPPTPVDERVRELQLALAAADSDVFARVVSEHRWALVTQDELEKLPGGFIKAFEPALPLVVVPLMVRNQTIGLVVADNKFTRSHITREDIDSLVTFVNTAAIAIDNVRLLHETETARGRLCSFYQASNALVSSQDLDQVLHDIVEQARVASGCAWVSMILIDETGQVRDLATAGIEKQFDVAGKIRPDGLSMQVMRTGEAEIIKDTREQRDRVNPSMFQDGVAAALCLPLSVQGRRIGVMWLHYREPRRFPEFETEALQLYVNQAAAACDSARRLQELRHMRRAAEALAGAASISGVLEQIVRSAREVLHADSSVIWPYDNVRHIFLPDELVTTGVAPELIERHRRIEPQPGGTAEEVMESGWISVTNVDDPQHAFLGSSSWGLRGAIDVKAFQGIALKVEDETLGILYVNYQRPRGFGAEERRTLETFATHAALALKKARLLEQVSTARNVAKVVAEVTALGDLESTLNSIVHGTQNALGCDAVTLYTYNQDKKKLGYPPTIIGVQYPKRVMRLSEVPRDSIVSEVLNRDAPYIVKDSASDRLFKDRRFVADEGIKSCAGIPLKVGHRRVGVMFVNYRSLHRFTEDELTNIGLFAHQAAVAIRNAQLFEETIRRANTLQALYEAGTAVTGTLALDETLNRIVAQAWRLTGQYGKYARFSDLELVEGTRLGVKAAYPAQHLAKIRRLVGDIDLEHDERIGIAGRAAKTGRCQLVGDVTQAPDYIEYDPETRSELAVPIVLGEEVIGVINVEHPETDAFDEQDWQALQALAAPAALAIRNAQLYQELERRISTLQALYQAGQAITSTLALQETLDQIVQQARLLMEGRQEEGCFSHLALVEGNVIHFAAACRPEILAGLRDEVGEIDLEHSPCIGVTGRVVKSGQSQNVADVSTDPDYITFESRVRSELAVPVKIGERVIGVINVEHPERDAFSPSDQQALESLAAQAAIAIRNARQSELQWAIYEASKVISSGVAIERQELLSCILKQAVTRIRWPQRAKAVLGIIQLYNEETNELCLESVYPSEEFPRLAERLGEKRSLARQGVPGGRIGIHGRAVLEGKVQRVPDVRTDPDYVQVYPGTLSELDVPLRIGDRMLGVLGLESDRLAAFDEMDERTLQSLAELSVIAIQNVQLYQEATRRLEESRALQQVATLLAGTLELERVLHVLMTAAMDLTGTDSGSILLWDAQQETFTRTLTTGPDQVLQSYRTTAREEGGIARAIIDDRKPMVIPDTEKDPRVNPVVLEKGRRALIGVPLISQETAIGVLYVSSSTPRRFSGRQVALLESLAGQATVAIERARQYEKLKEAKGLIGARTALAWMGMASSAWRHTIDKHALTIREQAQLLCQDCKRTASSQQDAKAHERIAIIQRLATQILEKPITPPLSTESGLESVSLNALIGERAKQLWQNDPYRKVVLQLDLRLSDDTTVHLSPEWLKRAFDVLVENAVDAVAGCEVQEVAIGTQMANGGVEIFVSDTGPGIPKDVQAKIGLDSIEKPNDAEGLGMGLLMAQTIVHAFGGNIRVASTGPNDTTMVIWLPLEE